MTRAASAWAAYRYRRGRGLHRRLGFCRGAARAMRPLQESFESRSETWHFVGSRQVESCSAASSLSIRGSSDLFTPKVKSTRTADLGCTNSSRNQKSRLAQGRLVLLNLLLSCPVNLFRPLPYQSTVKTSPTLNIYLLEYLTGGCVLPRVVVPLHLLCAIICPLRIVLLLFFPYRATMT